MMPEASQLCSKKPSHQIFDPAGVAQLIFYPFFYKAAIPSGSFKFLIFMVVVD
jgi:hypothetical protein